MMHWEKGVFTDGSRLFVSNMNPDINDEVAIRIRVFSGSGIERILLSTLINGEERVFPMCLEYSIHSFDYYSVPLKIVHYVMKYHFIIIKDNVAWIYNQRGLERHYSLKQWEFTIVAKAAYPEWVHDAVFYQIFPDRFYNGNEANDVYDGEYEVNGYITKKKAWTDRPSFYWEDGNLDFFGGDLDGIVRKLDYLTDLGVNAIYLNPIFTAHSNHKYDCIDYFHVDRHFGGDEALVRLVDALHDRDMRIVLDISINHVGKGHPWVNEEPQFFFYDEDGATEGWNGMVDLPVLNYNSERLRDTIYASGGSVLKKWLGPPYNADGWRFDVGQSTGLMKESKLDLALWRDIRREVKAVRPDAYLFAEHWDDCVCYLQGDMWDACMNYYGFTRTVRKFLGDADRFSDYKINNAVFEACAEVLEKEVMELYSLIPYSSRMSLFNLTSSHDYPRIGLVLPRTEAMISALFLFVFPGVPCVYYGDEVNIGGYLKQDSGFRFPMEWDKDKQDMDFYQLYRFLISYRRSSEVLKRGCFRFLYANADTVCIARFNENTCVLLVCSVTKTPARCHIALDAVGRYTICKAVREIGRCGWRFGDNAVTASFESAAGVLLELADIASECKSL